MKRFANRLVAVLGVVLVVWVCGPKKEPEPALPGYLRIPASLKGYEGSGLITVSGDIDVRAEGPEDLDAFLNTYSGVGGYVIKDAINAQFTVGQPAEYAKTYTVPAQYQANGQLLTKNALQPGSYPMGFQSQPTPTGAQADLILNLPGPQLYNAKQGALTIAESRLIKTEGPDNLYRIQGTFQTTLFGTGIGTVSSKEYTVTGTFDLLLVD
ncbi:hypothetical protein [Spirosoma sp. KNUC1025]|uniref:hypothetical protein n=1 Tax=Spirosoma sp. KNUC1025 TaxID=2894082 RepID=UPI001E64900A|nr:hypothetical protein [Spirosoma sp. KNUC1025]UFH57513.1 hypothetical protein LN737_30895 [Spirosoma sp. KNUC1025]